MSFGTKLLIGFIVSYILLNVLFQIILTSPPSRNVRHMKKLLLSLEPAQPNENEFRMLSLFPYATEIHQWLDNGRWIKELIHRIRENIKISWQILDWGYWPVRMMIRLWNKMEKMCDIWIDVIHRLNRELLHHLPI